MAKFKKNVLKTSFDSRLSTCVSVSLRDSRRRCNIRRGRRSDSHGWCQTCACPFNSRLLPATDVAW